MGREVFVQNCNGHWMAAGVQRGGGRSPNEQNWAPDMPNCMQWHANLPNQTEVSKNW